MKRAKLDKYEVFYKDPIVRNGFILGALLLLLNILTLAFFYRDLPPILPLFYSLARGTQQLVNRPFVLILPVFSMVFFVTHIILAWLNYSHDMIFSRVMSMSAAIVSFIFTVSVVHLIYLVL